MVRIEASHVNATARVLDREIDRELWEQVAAIAIRKFNAFPRPEGRGFLQPEGDVPPREED